MGSEMSRIRMEGPLRELLRVNGTPLKSRTARAFLRTVEGVSPWFLDEGLLNVPQWEHLGEDLRRADKDKPLPAGTLAIWALVRSCLNSIKSNIHEHLKEGELILEDVKEERSSKASERGDEPDDEEEEMSGEIKILASSPRGIIAVSPGDRIAQLLTLPSYHEQFRSLDVERGSKGLGLQDAI